MPLIIKDTSYIIKITSDNNKIYLYKLKKQTEKAN